MSTTRNEEFLRRLAKSLGDALVEALSSLEEVQVRADEAEKTVEAVRARTVEYLDGVKTEDQVSDIQRAKVQTGRMAMAQILDIVGGRKA